MKKRISLLSLILIFTPCVAFGQTDGISTNLVNTDEGWSPESSGHYVHKKTAKKKRTPASEDEDQDNDDDAPVSTKVVPTTTPTPSFTPSVMPRLMPESTAAAPSPTATPVSTGPSSDPSFSAKVRDMVLGGDSGLIQNYKNFLDRQDIRKNFFDFSMASGYFYNSSTSPFFSRNYNDAAPSLDLDADIWLSPFFGFNAEYRTTLLNELTDSPTSPITVNVRQSWLDLGLKFRRFFGMSANSPIFTSAIKYADYSMTVPTSSQYRVSQETQGVEFDFNLTVPTGKSSSLDMGFMLEPLATQNEHTGAALISGSGNQTIGAGANIALNYRVTRQMVGFLKLSSFLYKTEFSGATSVVDPIAGISLTNVPVTNVFYLLEFGLRLGR